MLFLILSVIFFSLISICIPKRISGIEMLSTVLFSYVLETLGDYILDLIYHLYGYFKKGPEWESLIYVFGIYPAINIIFLNFFPHEKGLSRKILYIGLWVLFAGFYEMLFLWSKTFYYNGWKIWYSLILYPFLYLTLVSFQNFTLYLIGKYKHREL